MLSASWYYDNTSRKLCPLDYCQPNILHTELGRLPLFELLILSCILLSYCLQNWVEENFDFVCNQ